MDEEKREWESVGGVVAASLSRALCSMRHGNICDYSKWNWKETFRFFVQFEEKNVISVFGREMSFGFALAIHTLKQ